MDLQKFSQGALPPATASRTYDWHDQYRKIRLCMMRHICDDACGIHASAVHESYQVVVLLIVRPVIRERTARHAPFLNAYKLVSGEVQFCRWAKREPGFPRLPWRSPGGRACGLVPRANPRCRQRRLRSSMSASEAGLAII
jgi:hypothetical protein